MEEEASSIFERFTEKPGKTVVLVQEEARHFIHSYIGTDYTLLGLAREKEDVAASIVSNLEVDAGRVRREVVGRLGGETSPVPGKMPLVEVGPGSTGEIRSCFGDRSNRCVSPCVSTANRRRRSSTWTTPMRCRTPKTLRA